MYSRRAVFEVMLLAAAVLLLGLSPGEGTYTAALRRAEVHRAAREYGAALDAYAQAAGLNPAAPLPWQRRGELLLVQHRFALAAEAFAQAEHRGGGLEAILGRAEAQAGRGDWAAAIGTWLRARARAPRDARPYAGLARAAVAQREPEVAGRHLARALALDPDPTTERSAHALLGRLRLADDPEQAAAHFSQAGDADMLAVLQAALAEPEPGRRVLLLGIAFLQRGELPLARAQFEQAIAHLPAGAEAHAYLGHVLDLLGETGAAQQAHDRALALDPGLALAYYFAAAHSRQIGHPRQAQALLWAGLQREPENAALRLEMAAAFLALHDYESAESWYRGALEVAPAAQEVEFHLALAHFYVDHLYHLEAGGVPAAEAAAALAPGDARAQDLLGWAYYLAGRPADAETVLARALTLDPGLASACYHLGSLYATTGRPALARPHLQRAADLDTGGYFRERAEILLAELD